MNVKKVLTYAFGPIGSALLAFISLPIITWFYDVEDVGKISMLQVVSSLTILFFCLGLDQAYTREYYETKDKPKLFKQVFLPGFILLVIFFCAVYIFDNQAISRWLYAEESRYLTLISITCFIFAFCSRFLSLILRMQERAFAYSMSQFLPKLFFLIFLLATVWLGFNKSIYNLITAHALSICTVFFVFAWNTRKDWITSIPKKINIYELKPLLHFGLPLVFGGLAAWGLKVIDKFFLRSLSTFTELGIYSVAISIAGAATIFSGVFNTIWAPLVYKWVSEGAVDFKKIDKVSESILAAVYFLVIISGLLSWIIPFLLPEEYSSIQFLISLCLLGPLFYTFSEVTAVGIAIAKKTRYLMSVSIIAMIVNGIGNYLLIPHFGATGAAISTGFSFWVYCIVRTEFSIIIWRKTARLKSYCVISALLFMTVINAVYLNGNVYSYIMWVTGFIVGIKVFASPIETLFNFLKLNISNKST